MNLAQALGISKFFGSTRALDGLSFELRSGEVLGLLGPNGAGKTTAIHILMGILTPDAGRVSIMGLCPFKDRFKVSQKINFSSAYSQLPTNLKVIENLGIFSKLYHIKNRRERIEEMIELFQLTELRNRLTGALSSGEKTRMNLCKGFLNNPELLFLDEPTTSLDPEMADSVRKTIKKIHREKGMGILYTSHNMKEVEEMCSRILFIKGGGIVAEGDRETLLQDFNSSSLEDVFIKIARGEKREGR